MLVIMGHVPRHAIRPIRFTPTNDETGAIEITTLDRMRKRGGPAEFTTPQRLEFDMLVRVDHGRAAHTVDFTQHHLGVGDILWVRAGQVHRWGAIADINGHVALFAPHAVDPRTQHLLAQLPTANQNHWTAEVLHDAVVGVAWTLLLACGTRAVAPAQEGLRRRAVEHALSAVLLQLTIVGTSDGPPGPARSHEAYRWFCDEIDRRFDTWHQVNDYAARLGYSTRTLNRLARSNTGLSAKQLIDERVVLEAKRLLSHGDEPVADVASQLGFDDPSNFSSYFQRHTGETPGVFRRGLP